MHPFRSMLFVPGHRPDWADKAVRSGADAIVLDLEDAVPEPLKVDARTTVAATIARLRAEGVATAIFVRPNGLATGLSGADLETAVVPGVDGLLLPMVTSGEDVIRWDALVDWFERRNNVTKISFVITIETVGAIENCRAIAAASPRVAGLVGQSAARADLAREVGYRWSEEGLETLYLRSRILLACKEFGLHPVTALWENIEDTAGLRRFAERGLALGYRGQIAIHPSHIAVLQQVYSPDPDEIAFNEGLVAAFEEAVAQGNGAVRYRGAHIDKAHADTARAWLRQARNVLDGPI